MTLERSDIETLRVMLTKARLRYTERVSDYIGDDDYNADRAGDRLLTLVPSDERERPQQHGYYRFYAEFVFAPDGALKTIGAWE